jgi:hypothetical protein
MLPILLLLTYFNSFWENPIQKQLTRKWELVSVQMSKKIISAEELKRKNNNLTMQIFEDGRCIIKANNPQAVAKQNKWLLEANEKENFLIIEAENDFGGKVKTKFKIEEISTKKLILSIGEAQDKETYYYKSIK